MSKEVEISKIDLSNLSHEDLDKVINAEGVPPHIEKRASSFLDVAKHFFFALPVKNDARLHNKDLEDLSKEWSVSASPRTIKRIEEIIRSEKQETGKTRKKKDCSDIDLLSLNQEDLDKIIATKGIPARIKLATQVFSDSVNFPSKVELPVKSNPAFKKEDVERLSLEWSVPTSPRTKKKVDNLLGKDN